MWIVFAKTRDERIVKLVANASEKLQMRRHSCSWATWATCLRLSHTGTLMSRGQKYTADSLFIYIYRVSQVFVPILIVNNFFVLQPFKLRFFVFRPPTFRVLFDV